MTIDEILAKLETKPYEFVSHSITVQLAHEVKQLRKDIDALKTENRRLEERISIADALSLTNNHFRSIICGWE